MPRILIADDNSNIQRMAALALKDAGIEVVAVGNGEAAVRKLREVSPDLVLADIFMPVRNGYEVCEFVKHDPKYSNTPVLLLAGAFDPFDEREAQRVQADGILKKPFVPPDPLINAVKTLLEKSAGERLMAVTAPADPSVTATAESATSAATTAPPAATVAEPTPSPIEDAEGQAYAEPLSVVDFLTNSAKDAAKEKPASFSASPSFEIPQVDEPEPVVTASRDPVLGEPAFWTSEEPEQAAPSAQEDSPEDLVDHTWGSSGRPAPMRNDPDPPPMMLDLEAKPASAIDDFDVTDFAPISHEPVNKSATAPVQEPVAPELPEIEFASVPAAGLPDPAHSAPEASVYAHREIAAPAIPAPAAIFAAPEILAPAAPTPHATDTSSEDTLPLPEAVVESAEVEMTPLQNSSLPEMEAKLPEIEPDPLLIPGAESFLDATVSIASAEPGGPGPIPATEDDESSLLELEDSPAEVHDFAAPPSAPPIPEPQPWESALQPKEPEPGGEWPPAFVPVTSASANATHAPAAEPAPEPATAAALSPEAQEALIQRVIERVQPQIVELMTRQILRPLVESILRNEFNQK